MTEHLQIIQEHDELPSCFRPFERRQEMDEKSLFRWDYTRRDGWGVYSAYFRIGAEWMDERSALIVKPKMGLESIDWPLMFLDCFTTEEGCETGLGKIYHVDADSEPIRDKTLQNVITPMIVMHFLASVQKIVSKGLKRGLVRREENLRKVKGRIRFLQNLRKNLLVGRADRILCRYEEESVDIPENQVLKQALVVSNRMIRRMKSQNYSGETEVDRCLGKCMSAFESVTAVGVSGVRLSIRQNKLYKEYGTAIRLARLILKMCDNVIDREDGELRGVPPFWLDMSLLYEHYVFGLLRQAYGRRILYQAGVSTGYPDFLFADSAAPQIIDTKYKPRYEGGWPCLEDLRQLSGYARDRSVLRRLGICDEVGQDSSVVPCVIVFPGADGMPQGCKRFDAGCTPMNQNGVVSVSELVKFYLLRIDLPRVP